MSEQLNVPPHPPLRWSAGTARHGLLALGAFATAGILVGVLWSVLVTPSVGVVHEGTVWQSGLSSQSEFGVTGWYLLLGFGVAVVLGGVLAWRLVDHEYAVLIGLILGSVAAALLASAVGAALGPASPEALAAGLPDGTEVEINLAVHPLAWVSWPIGALMAAMVVWLSFPTPSRRHD